MNKRGYSILDGHTLSVTTCGALGSVFWVALCVIFLSVCHYYWLLLLGGGVTLCFKVSLLDPLRDKSLGI